MFTFKSYNIILIVIFYDCVINDTADGILSNGSCTAGQKRCEKHYICIPNENVCNTFKDCPDGSDEYNCTDSHIDAAFDAQYNKRPVHEVENVLNKTCEMLYTGKCICREDIFICHNQGFKEIPQDFPKERTIKLLDLTGNYFNILQPKIMHGLPSYIEQLVFSHCEISEITGGAFQNVFSLSELYLDNNKLQVLTSNIFLPKLGLKRFILRHNRIYKIDDSAFKTLDELEELDLSHNLLSKINGALLKPLIKLDVLSLHENRLSRINIYTFPSHLPITQLSLNGNIVKSIEAGSFSSLSYLIYLHLSGNRLRTLQNGTFDGLTALKYLDLSENVLQNFESGVFNPVTNLRSLNLKYNAFKTILSVVLQQMTKLNHIYFDRFDMCLSASQVRNCEPRGDGISSQEHLLDNPVLRTSVWMMASVGCAGNLIVLLGRLFGSQTNVVHSLYFRNLALSDLLMGIYLFTIATADRQYRGVYLQYEYRWRHSNLCGICGFLSTLSCESSLLILTLVTWDRYVSLTQPLARHQPSARTTAFTLATLWSTSAAVALIPLSGIGRSYFGDEFYGSNGVCLSLHIHEPFAKGWEYSAATFVVVNSVALIFICYAYIRMILVIKHSGLEIRSTRQSHDRDKVAQRFGIIILTDCFCWVPVIAVKTAALTGVQISEGLYAWLAVLVLPINSALNPVLYTLTTPMFKKQIRKILPSCFCKKKIAENQMPGFDSAYSMSMGGVFPLHSSNRKVIQNRTTQSSLNGSKNNSWKRPPTAV